MKIAQYGTTIVRWFCGLTDPAGSRSLKSLPKDSVMPGSSRRTRTDDGFLERRRRRFSLGGNLAEQFISRGFKGRARDTDRALKERIPPGQFETKEFPVLSAGPTPRTLLESWVFSIYGEVAEELKWTWDEFRGLPRETVTVDIHCVTKWSKLDTVSTGISVDTLLRALTRRPAGVRYLIAFCDGGYTTNLPLADVRGGKAWVVYKYDGKPLEPVARRPGPPARAAPLFLEKREMG